MSDNTIEVSDEAVGTLAEALDDALVMARIDMSKVDSVEPVARQTLSVLAQFGWTLVNTNPVELTDNDEEPRELNLLAPGTIEQANV